MRHPFLLTVLLMTTAAVLSATARLSFAQEQTQPIPRTEVRAQSTTSQSTTTGDWEDLLARQGKAQRAWRFTLNRLAGKSITPDQRQKIINSVIERFPDSEGAAKQHVSLIKSLGESSRWDEYLSASDAWLKQHGRWSDPKHDLLYDMARRLHQKDVSQPIKSSMFDMMLPHLTHRAWLTGYLSNYIERLDLPEPQKYEMARQAVDKAGKDHRLLSMLWRRIASLQSTDMERTTTAARKLLQEYGPDHVETRQAKILVLQQAALNGDAQAAEQARELQKETSQAIAKVKADFEQMLQILQGDDSNAALLAWETVLGNTPSFARLMLWQRLVGVMGDMSSPVRMALMRQYAGVLPDVATAEVFRLWAMRDLVSHPEDIDVLLKIQQQCNNDAGRSLNMWDYTLTQIKNNDYAPGIMVRAYALAADTATALGAHDQATNWLFEAARLNWVFDLPAAKAQLARAAQTRDWSASGVKAAWFLAYLNGENDVIQSSLPRDYDQANHILSELPSCPLPAIGRLQPAVVQTQNGWELATNDSAANLLAKQLPTATTDSAHAALTTDGDPSTAWEPTTLPAVLILPLKHQATPARISLNLKNPTHLAISFLDERGRPLARFERDWSFWDTYATDAMWADGNVTLNLPPADNVSFVRLELFQSQGLPSVNEVALYPTAHRATGWHVSKPVKLEKNNQAVVVHHKVIEPAADVTLHAQTEATRGYPIYRWTDPWKRTKSPALPKQFGGNLSQVFHGRNLSITLSHAGGIDWQIDDGPIVEINKTDAQTQTFMLADNLKPGRHLLRLARRALPAHEDQYGANDVRLVSMQVDAKATAIPAVRFGNDGQTWGPWYETSSTQSHAVSVAALSDGSQPAFVQAGVWFDARSTQCTVSPVVESLTLEPVNQTGSASPMLSVDYIPKLTSELDEVARLLLQRKAVVVYPKVGSPQVYAHAKALADKAHVYLVSDDMALNDYPGLVLAVGSPLRHRYTRQLLATHALWFDENTLQSQKGLVTILFDKDHQPKTLYVMGETDDAIAAAAARLHEKMDQIVASDSLQIAKAVTSPVEIFTASTLEMIYPWQLNIERKTLQTLTLRLGLGDRRSTQFGLRFNAPVDTLDLTVSDFKTDDGRILPASQTIVRFASGYEWIPFFGDLRLPNGLSHRPVLPIAQNTALGIWITTTTTHATRPGQYHGRLTMRANNTVTHIPTTITIEPVTLPRSPSIATYSFAGVPYWYTPGSELWRTAVTSLAVNEADHRVNYVSVDFSLSWSAARHESPGQFAIVSNKVSVEDTDGDTERQWQPLLREVVVKPGQAMEVAFSQPILPWKVGIGFTGQDIRRVLLQVKDDQQRWRDVASYDDFSTMPPPVVLDTRETLTSPARVYRVVFDSSSPVTVHKLTAFTDRSEHDMLTCDFGQMFEQMKLIDAAYEQRGLPLSGYISQVHVEAGHISRLLFGVYSITRNICTQLAGQQLASALKKTGRSDRFLLKVGDEPSDLVAWSAMAEPYKEAGLRTMTCHGVHYADMSVATGLINPWAPNYQHNINLPFLRERQKQGDKLWWYECGVPVTRLTGSPVENLPFYWLTAKWRLDGAMNYAAMHSSDFVMPVPFRYEHGMDHRLLFRADGSVLDTTRRELESDGIGDHELITLIRRQLGQSKTAAAKDIQTRLDALIEAIVPYKYGYETNERKWEEARDALYDMAIESR